MKRLIPLFLCLALLLSACGGSKAAPETGALRYELAEDTAMAAESPADMGAQSMNSSSTAVDLPENRKFVITMGISAETEDLDGAVAGISQALQEAGGYVQDQSIQNGSAYSGRRYRSGDMTLRVPAEKLDAFTQTVEGCTNVVSSSRSTEDVTLQYVDTESRVNALKTEQTRLLELLSQADNMTDLLEIESRLTDVRDELERYASRLKVLENRVDYATVNLSISEVKEYTPVEEKTRLEKIGEGFVKSLKDLGSGILDFFTWLLIDLPYLLVFGLVLFLAVKLLKAIRKKKKAKKQKKEDAQ